MLRKKEIQRVTQLMNAYGDKEIPFVFLIDYEKQQPKVWTLEEVDPAKLLYDFNGYTNFKPSKKATSGHPNAYLERFPISYGEYEQAFNKIQKAIRQGDSYLANLTFPTKILTNLSLKQIFCEARAPYRFWWKDHFVLFSPEPFVQIQEGKISSFPMKGTIDASLPGAEMQLMNDPKEKAEHATITDLIRNDLSRVARRVRVERYRYVEEIESNESNLLQTSTKIVGELPADFHRRLGDIIFDLLPAGSISGAPKAKTVEILQDAELGNRGYYTGVLGCFDGQKLDTAVCIRFIEEKDGAFFYRSGGGITAFSKSELEYREMIQKVYLPFLKKERKIHDHK